MFALLRRASLLLFLATIDAGAAEEPAIAYSAFLTGDADRARLVVEFDRDVAVRLAFSVEPARLVVELPPTAFRLGRELEAVRSGLVGEIGVDQSESTRSRIVLDLDAPIAVARQSLEAVGSGTTRRLTLDLVRSEEREFAALVRSAPVRAPVVERSQSEQSQAQLPLVVLDPGHGGRDGGARGRKRTLEKDVTLRFARTFAAKLRETGAFRVRLTRDRDTFLSLARRVKIAADADAALFISIHADSLAQRRIRGATVYTLSKTASDDVAAVLATEQNRADLAAGLQTETLDTSAADILLDLMKRETDDRSSAVAERVVKALGAATRLIRNPNRAADFYVLRSPRVPSVLLELGYLSNGEDEKLLVSQEWQRTVATSLANGLAEFFRAD